MLFLFYINTYTNYLSLYCQGAHDRIPMRSRDNTLIYNIMVQDYLAYKAIEDSDKNKCGNKIAWVIGIVLAFIVLAIVWSTMNRNQQEANNRATDFAFRTNERVGALEGNQVVVGDILRTTTGNVSALLQTVASNATNVAAQGRVLDELAVITARPYYATSGCGNGGALASAINPKFRQVNEYQQCNSRLFEESTCGNAAL